MALVAAVVGMDLYQLSCCVWEDMMCVELKQLCGSSAWLAGPQQCPCGDAVWRSGGKIGLAQTRLLAQIMHSVECTPRQRCRIETAELHD